MYGYDPYPGAYAEYAAVPPIATKNLIGLPPELPSDLATVADPFACALNGIEQLDVRLGDAVMIIGTGPIGCWQAVMARDRGASRVYMTDVSSERLKVATDAVGHLIDDAWVAGDDNGVSRLAGPDGRRRCGADQRRGPGEGGTAGRVGDGIEAGEKSSTSPDSRSTTRSVRST